jgi:hypothetical protein
LALPLPRISLAEHFRTTLNNKGHLFTTKARLDVYRSEHKPGSQGNLVSNSSRNSQKEKVGITLEFSLIIVGRLRSLFKTPEHGAQKRRNCTRINNCLKMSE